MSNRGPPRAHRAHTGGHAEPGGSGAEAARPGRHLWEAPGRARDLWGAPRGEVVKLARRNLSGLRDASAPLRSHDGHDSASGVPTIFETHLDGGHAG